MRGEGIYLQDGPIGRGERVYTFQQFHLVTLQKKSTLPSPCGVVGCEESTLTSRQLQSENPLSQCLGTEDLDGAFVAGARRKR
eukprot:8065129-Pyramimonas_sp.AAC.2